jgi:SpoVK/Ycf46/Vps4 family AAA+-type ATPase
MNLELIDVITYLSLGLIAYYFLIEITNPKKGAQKWVTWIFIAIITLIIGYFLWVAWKKKDKKKGSDKKGLIDNGTEDSDIDDDEVESTDETMESDPQVSFIQETYIPDKKDFALIDGASSEVGQIKYDDFKLWYLTPDFLGKYSNAIRQGLQIKRRRLMEVKKKYLGDVKALKGQSLPKEGLAGLLSALDKNDDAKMLETTLNEIELLLKEIKRKERTLSIDSTRKGLISALTDRNNGIDSLTGREDVKDFLALQIYTFAQNPRIFFSNFQNMAIYGPSGVGKTKLAQVIGHVYASSGILVRNHVHVVTKQSMTTAYVNESAKMTRKLLLANLESIIFVDEAYDMTPPPTIFGNSIDHGHEAITEMVNFIDKMKGLSIIIVAGYEDEMEKRFMKANEGLPRRFPHKLILKSYGPKELTDILIKFTLTTCPELRFTREISNYFYTIISYINKDHSEMFKNQAGDMENLSGFIARAVYGSPGKSWSQDHEEIILSGVNAFLARKGVTLELLE